MKPKGRGNKMQDYMNKIEEYLKKKSIPYNNETIQKLKDYIQAVFEQNKVMNLTAAKTLDEIAIRHCLDSLTICEVIQFKEKEKILDLGTGGGFPGIPLAIIYPETEFTLIDSVKKKLEFIERTCEQLKIKNVQTCHGRIEDLGHNRDFREKFDFVCARALAPLAVLLEYCIPFLKAKGQMISYKGKNVETEITEAKHAFEILKAEIKYQHSVKLSIDERVNYFLVIQKTKSTPAKYPRKAGLPKKKPL